MSTIPSVTVTTPAPAGGAGAPADLRTMPVLSPVTLPDESSICAAIAELEERTKLYRKLLRIVTELRAATEGTGVSSPGPTAPPEPSTNGEIS